MNDNTHQTLSDKKARRLLFWVTVLILFFLLVSQVSLRRSNYSIKIGDVAFKDITAPRTITYISDILTEEARAEAEKTVSDVYLPADPTISRNQLQNLRYTFQFIQTVRADNYATLPQKIADINNLSLVSFDEATINQLLELEGSDWETLQTESIRVLESVMQNSIRDVQVIGEVESIPAMINYYISQPVANLVTIFVGRFVTANSLLSKELTQKGREDARAAVQPRERTFVINQTVVQRGEVVSDLAYEALNKMGLVTTHNSLGKYVSVFCLLLSLGWLFRISAVYMFDPTKINMRGWLLISALLLVYVFIGRMVIPNRTVIPYVFPLPALGMTISCLFGRPVANVIVIIASILVPYDQTNVSIYIFFYLVSSLVAVMAFGKGRQINTFLTAGICGNLIGIPLIVAGQYINSAGAQDLIGLLTLGGAALLGGLLSAAVSLLSQYIFSSWVGVTTPIQLMELLRPDSSLLQHLLQTTPGTYQHSLQVANLAEQAARDIGADALLTRAGAMYHDLGKTANPLYFVENQVAGQLDLHEELTPAESAANIIHHVTDGVELLKKNHLPQTIINFASQHHGTNVTRFQMGQAIRELGEENVDPKDFTYPGPIPQSKETALVMLADTTEARARAERPSNEDEIRALVKDVFNLYMGAGQMDDAPLTMHDFTAARESFVRTLKNIYHPRVRYPGTGGSKGSQKEKEQEDETPLRAHQIPAISIENKKDE